MAGKIKDFELWFVFLGRAITLHPEGVTPNSVELCWSIILSALWITCFAQRKTSPFAEHQLFWNRPSQLCPWSYWETTTEFPVYSQCCVQSSKIWFEGSHSCDVELEISDVSVLYYSVCTSAVYPNWKYGAEPKVHSFRVRKRRG